MKWERVDTLLFKIGLVESREKAKVLIQAGKVFVNGERILKPSKKIPENSKIEIKGEEYVSRGYLKLMKALDDFKISVEGKVCVDVGASTGGFTQLLLERGAKLVYAVDVGKGLLHQKLRNDKRVVVMEGINARYLKKEMFPQKPDLVVVDVSFISLTKILPPLHDIVDEVIALLKPNFELPKKFLKKGIAKDEKARQEAINMVIEKVKNIFKAEKITQSSPPGKKGNIEYFILFRKI